MRHNSHVVVVLFVHLLQPGGELKFIDADLDADLTQLRSDDPRYGRPIGQIRNPQPQREPTRIARFLKQLLRFRRIIRVGVGEVFVPRIGGRHHDPINVPLPPQALSMRAFRSIAWLMACRTLRFERASLPVIEPQHHLTVGGAFEHLEPGCVRKLAHRLWNGQVGDDVELT